MAENRVVLCGANAYEQKYYFNEQFHAIPQSIKDELRIICVLFTEEVGGIFTLVFEEDGTLNMETTVEEYDIYYDEIIDPVIRLDKAYSHLTCINCTGRLEGDRVLLDTIPPYGFAAFQVG